MGMVMTAAANTTVTDAVPSPVVLDAVTKRYGRRRGAVPALDGVSLTFAAGSFTAVLGVSGSGKSTLLQCAAGLERTTSGRVQLCGQDLSQLSQRKQAVLRRQRVGFVFQDLNLLPELTVAENIALPLRLDHRRARRAWTAASCDGGQPNCPAASSSGWPSPGL
jgi:putative ABC transport system ATP-binding protein